MLPPLRTASQGSLKIAVGAILGAVAVGAVALSPVTLSAFVLILCLVATGEFHRLARGRGAYPVPAVALSAVVALFVAAYRQPVRLVSWAPGIIAAALGATLLVGMLRKKRAGSTLGFAATAFSVVYFGLFGSFIVSMRRMPHGFKIVLTFGLMAVLNDAGSYFAGRFLGRRRLAPSVSPDKTWEGVMGGTAATLIVAAFAVWLMNPPFSASRAFLLAMLVAVAAPLGDLVESTLKRDAGVKDSGRVVPGHGGVMDRLDSVLLAAPVFWYAYRVFVG